MSLGSQNGGCFGQKLQRKLKKIVFNNLFFSLKNRAVYDMWKKYSRAGQETDDNTAHAHCMLDTYGYRHTLRI
jgi:hypothetical protein